MMPYVRTRLVWLRIRAIYAHYLFTRAVGRFVLLPIARLFGQGAVNALCDLMIGKFRNAVAHLDAMRERVDRAYLEGRIK